jgi:phage portal protein BeeE
LRLFGYEFKLMATKAGSSGLASPSGWLTSMLGGGTTASGVSISESNALQVSDVYKCVRVLSEAVAMLPWKVYQRVDRGKNLAIDHAVFSVLHDEPNDYMTSFVFRELLMAHVLLWGNSYGYIERTKGGKVVCGLAAFAGRYALQARKRSVELCLADLRLQRGLILSG